MERSQNADPWTGKASVIRSHSLSNDFSRSRRPLRTQLLIASPLRTPPVVMLVALQTTPPSSASLRIASPHTAPPRIAPPSTSSRDTPRGPDGFSIHHSFSHRLCGHSLSTHCPYLHYLSYHFIQSTQRLRSSPLDIVGAFTLST